MKIALQYVSDSSGKTQSVQVTLTDWEKLMDKLKKYEQTLKIKSDLKEAFQEVARLRKSKAPKQTLKEFLNEI
jgi:asparagine synthetase A